MDIILVILVLIFFIMVVTYISIYNSFRKIEAKVMESYSGIDVALSKRFNAVTNCLEVCKGYCKHEKEVLAMTVELRNKNLQDMIATDDQLDEASKVIVALKESYPDLKADNNFLKLQDIIIDSEEHLQAARRFYNSNVSLLNEKVMVFPSNIIAQFHHISKKEYFKANDEEKKNIRIM